MSRSNLAGDAIEGFSDVTLMYAGSPDSLSRYAGQLGLYYGRGRLGAREDIQEGIRWISEAGLEIGARRYFARTGHATGFFWLTGLRFGAMWWSYARSFELEDEEGGTVSGSSDGTMYGTPYFGLGASFLPTRSFAIGVSATAGCRFTGNDTFKGLNNDLFKDVGEFSLNFEVAWFF
jgi:hypothetical protein